MDGPTLRSGSLIYDVLLQTAPQSHLLQTEPSPALRGGARHMSSAWRALAAGIKALQRRRVSLWPEPAPVWRRGQRRLARPSRGAFDFDLSVPTNSPSARCRCCRPHIPSILYPLPARASARVRTHTHTPSSSSYPSPHPAYCMSENQDAMK